jgi:hypothetical protein
MTDLSELSAVLEKLPETERAIAMRVSLMTAKRLLVGLTVYGPLDINDGRDWVQEGLAEHVDGAVYAVAETMRRERSD